MGEYVIGVFDILGQNRKLLQPVNYPPRTDEEMQRVDRITEETSGAVRWFRDLFARQFRVRRAAFELEVMQMQTEQHDEFREAMELNIVSWGMSDTYIVAVPVDRSSTPGHMAAMANVRRLFEVAAVTWLAALADNNPIRGGVEIGAAIGMSESEVYGQALAKAYRLESRIAGWPRIVVGEKLVAMLRELRERRQDPDVHTQGAAEFATRCCSLLRHDPDGKAAIDVLGRERASASPAEFRRVVFPGAHANVRNQLRSHQAAEDTKLVSRYTTLLAYFDEHATLWQEQ